MVDLGVEAGDRNGLAFGIDRGHVEPVLDAAAQIFVVPLIDLLLGLDADVDVEGGQAELAVAGAEFAGRLVGPQGESGTQHAGYGALVQLDAGADRTAAAAVRLHGGVGEALVREFPRIILEIEVLVALEGGPGVREVHFAFHLQAAAGSAVQPVHGDGAARVAVHADQRRGETQVDVQLVGLDGLDADALGEGLAAELDLHGPASRPGVGMGREGEMEQGLALVAPGQGLDLLAVRVAQPGRHRIAGRQGAVVKEHDGPDVEGVAGTPDAPFAEDIGLDAIPVGRAFDVEVAGGQGFLVLQVQVGVAVAGSGDEEAGVVPCGDGEVSVPVGHALAELLPDEVVELDAGAADGLAAEDVEGEDVHGLVAPLGHQGEVAAQQAHAPLPVSVIIAEGIVAVVEILLDEGLPPADLDIVDGARLRPDHLVELQGVGLLRADVRRGRASQHDQRVCDEPGDAVQLVACVVTVLHVLEHVAFEDFPDPDLRLGVAGGDERQVQPTGRGQDGTLAHETDGGDDLFVGEQVCLGASPGGSGLGGLGGEGRVGRGGADGRAGGLGRGGSGGGRCALLGLVAACEDKQAGEYGRKESEGFHSREI